MWLQYRYRRKTVIRSWRPSLYTWCPLLCFIEKKERGMTQSYIKSPYTNRNKKSKWQHKTPPNNFHYTTILDRLRTKMSEYNNFFCIANCEYTGIDNFQSFPAICGRVIRGQTGELTSPNYPDNYQPNKECEWVIIVDQDHTVALNVDTMEVHAFKMQKVRRT